MPQSRRRDTVWPSPYSPPWRPCSVRGRFTYPLPLDITAGVSYTGNAGPWSGPVLDRLAADGPEVTQYGPGHANNGEPNPLATRFRFVGQDRGDLQVRSPTIRTIDLSAGKIFDVGAM